MEKVHRQVVLTEWLEALDHQVDVEESTVVELLDHFLMVLDLVLGHLAGKILGHRDHGQDHLAPSGHLCPCHVEVDHLAEKDLTEMCPLDLEVLHPS